MCSSGSDATFSHTINCPQHTLIGNPPQLTAYKRSNDLNLQSNE